MFKILELPFETYLRRGDQSKITEAHNETFFENFETYLRRGVQSKSDDAVYITGI